MNIILEAIFGRGESLRVSEIENIADQIVTVFPNENKVNNSKLDNLVFTSVCFKHKYYNLKAVYFIQRNNKTPTRGKLYDRYNNRLKLLRKKRLAPESRQTVNKKLKLTNIDNNQEEAGNDNSSYNIDGNYKIEI